MPLINQNTELRSNYHITNMRFLSGVEFIRGEKKKKSSSFSLLSIFFIPKPTFQC